MFKIVRVSWNSILNKLVKILRYLEDCFEVEFVDRFWQEDLFENVKIFRIKMNWNYSSYEEKLWIFRLFQILLVE